MNKTITSLMALGVGAVAFNMTRGNNNLVSPKAMKRIRKQMKRAFS